MKIVHVIIIENQIFYREITKSLNGDRYETEEETIHNKSVAKQKMQESYNLMIESVIKYKGFYVARYEAGIDSNDNIVSKDASLADNNITTLNGGNIKSTGWKGLYEALNGCFVTSTDSINSSMIWGSQYDAMLIWMIKQEKSISKDMSKTNTTEITGGNKNDVINNIYDLRGCHSECTLERGGTGSGSRVVRRTMFK